MATLKTIVGLIVSISIYGQKLSFGIPGQELEAEGNDRASMELPGKQLQLLKDAVKFGNISSEF